MSDGPVPPCRPGEKPPLLFIRHGETDWNRAARLQGQQDIPLNALGRRQAERNGRAVAGILRSGDWRLVASPLGRSMETMRILLAAAGRRDAQFATDPVLMEACYGDWEGLTLPEVAERDPEGARARERDKWAFVPPAGESYCMLSDRLSAWLGSAGCADAARRPWRHLCASCCTCSPASRHTTPLTLPLRRIAPSCSPRAPC